MTRNVSTCSPSDTVKSIMKQMTACKLSHLPVVEQEQLVGIVSATWSSIRSRKCETNPRCCTTTSKRPNDCQRKSLQPASANTDIIFATADRCFVEATMWRLTKAIIISCDRAIG
jgi:CBS-domain-containing membrane protein